MVLRRHSRDSVTIDHIIPRCDGGTYRIDNIVGACWACNNARGSAPYMEFLERVLANGRPNNAPNMRRVARKLHKKKIIKYRAGQWNPKPSRKLAYIGPSIRERLLEAGFKWVDAE